MKILPEKQTRDKTLLQTFLSLQMMVKCHLHAVLVDPIHEINFEVCAKIFVIPKKSLTTTTLVLREMSQVNYKPTVDSVPEAN